MGYWKWLGRRIKEVPLRLIPKRIGTPEQEYLWGCMVSIFSFFGGLFAGLWNTSLMPWLLGLSFISFFFGTHGWYRAVHSSEQKASEE